MNRLYWLIEFFMVCFGILAGFFLEKMGLDACFLCYLARFMWIIYLLMLLFFYFYPRVIISYLLDIFLIFLTYIAVYHNLVIYKVIPSCFSWILFVKQYPIFSFLNFSNLRDCGDEFMLFGFLSLPLCMIFIYIIWFCMHIRQRKILRSKYVSKNR